MLRRSSGLLLHVTSLPSPFGIGDLGPEAYRFAEALARTGQSVWQVLPLSPTDVDSYNDPYHSIGALAGNPLCVSPALLVRDGLLDAADIATPPAFPVDRVDFPAVTAYKRALLDKAYARFQAHGGPDADPDYGRFHTEHAGWLDDFALFAALCRSHGNQPWHQWPEPLRDRHPEALDAARRGMAGAIDRVRFEQYLFERQWRALRAHCRALGVAVFGDMPIYVDHNSADVWAHPGLFKLGPDRMPVAVSGVPPDYFSATGQLWGTPVYDWDALAATGFDWWLRRVERNLGLFDLLRIDHFRGLVAYWEVPAGEPTAMNGEWVEAPVDAFLGRLQRRFSSLPIIAEDLGVITPDVREVMRRFGLPGMKILLFAFGGDMPRNPYMPHNMEPQCVAYTGTHDNNPALAWFDTEASDADKARLFSYLGREVAREAVPWELARVVMGSVAALAVLPMQDVLGLDGAARMNRPGNLAGNWGWRLAPGAFDEAAQDRLGAMTRLYGRD